MQFRPIPCHKSLQPFIRNYWFLSAECTDKGTQRIYSNGAASLHFYLTQEVLLDGSEQRYRAALNRHDLSCMEITTEQGQFNILGVEFVPFCALLFFDMKSGPQHLSPEETGDKEFVTLTNQIRSTTDTETQVRLLDDFFTQRIARIPEDDININRLSNVFDSIVPTDGRDASVYFDSVSPSDLASTACLSQKQFTRVFSEYVGMNPKSYLRLLRFHKALQELHRSPTHTPLTEIAWTCGYYDLAHMTNDFRQLCGHSPSEVLEMGDQLTEAFQTDFSGLMKKKVLLENVV